MDLNLDSIATVEASDMLSSWLSKKSIPLSFGNMLLLHRCQRIWQLLGLFKRQFIDLPLQERAHQLEPIAIVGGVSFLAENIDAFWQI